MAPVILRTLAGALYAAVTGLFYRPPGVPYLRHVALSGIRAMGRNEVYDASIPFTEPTTLDGYLAFAKKKKFEPNVVSLDQNGQGLWVGSPNTKKVVLFFHGGAYVHGAFEGHFNMLLNLIAAAKAHGKEISIFVHTYDLGHQSQYPNQLRQAAGALKYLLSTAKYAPEDIVVFGDSAGGHLAISLMSHLSHKHPEIPAVTELGDRTLSGLALISPWIHFEYNSKSVRENANIDMLTPSNLSSASNRFLGGAGPDNYNAPLSAPAEWWEGIKAKHVLVTGGGYELLRDDIHEFGKNMKIYNPEAEVFIAEQEVHDQMLMDIQLGYPTCKSERRLHQWLLKVL